jgi:hypothetical protein
MVAHGPRKMFANLRAEIGPQSDSDFEFLKGRETGQGDPCRMADILLAISKLHGCMVLIVRKGRWFQHVSTILYNYIFTHARTHTHGIYIYVIIILYIIYAWSNTHIYMLYAFIGIRTHTHIYIYTYIYIYYIHNYCMSYVYLWYAENYLRYTLSSDSFSPGDFYQNGVWKWIIPQYRSNGFS